MREEENERLTRTGPGTPGGDLMRRYWQPVALSEELDGVRPLVAPKVLGQDLVLFRDEHGELGLVDRGCPHRGADLALGRLEDGGLRCCFHGWLFARDGACLDTPAEPADSALATRVRLGSYPVREINGVIWGYLGPGEPPALPALDCFEAPADHAFAWKGLLECNWLQALEVGIDPAHASYLHRFFEDEDPSDSYGKQFRATSQGTALPMTKILREYGRPDIDAARTPYGLRITALRTLDGTDTEGRAMDGSRTHVRVTHQVFPHGFHIPLDAETAITQWHVPIDDTSCYWYAQFTSVGRPVDQEAMRRQRVDAVTLPDYRPRFNRANGYGYDPVEQLTTTYTGLGTDINVHDQWAVEGQGAVQDRTREHLGRSDKAIVMYRRMLGEAMSAVQRGEDPPLVLPAERAAGIRGPVTLDGIGPTKGSAQYWAAVTAKQRADSSWAQPAATDG
ncbi:aromatic ring-hydroxylating dioxygenase subunit alpha [Streptomyces sp. S.PB5]|uniref:aromatic ring-hydroxylating dioxygenase subunit alpha n=1 Tax=Streptomyces sp. S.PB5 TaxID=3020844 RepID=UPI0025AEFB16|nr:aromatic ring-hydroxylating dioxygenase subunit alpha [Streptomyces sp. S.PB5]MDN3028291.1 aromatic ring-hydroxylating dioxygenase subunit alpha [Streptomyces sp. S.PB5]